MVNEKLSMNIDGLASTVGVMRTEIREHLKLIRTWKKQSDAYRKQSKASERVLNKLLGLPLPVNSATVNHACENDNKPSDDYRK